jgi:NAD(P)H-nitrite reductase large subunit
MGKKILCHCEDVTLEELHSAIKQGYHDIETLKRYTGIATGKCQGKCCLIQTIRTLSDASSKGTPKLTTIRQPVLPLRIDEIVDLGEEKT